MRYLLIILFCLDIININAQNLISNPDFSDVVVFYDKGKHVYPNNWKSIDWPAFKSFYHKEKTKDGDFFSEPNKKSIGIVDICPYQGGICTKLKSKLICGETYDISIEIKINKIFLSSGWNGRVYDSNGHLIDSANLDYNYIMSLVTFFSKQEPKVNDNLEKGYAILEFPTHITPDSSRWMELSTSYLSKGDEEYFSIGSFNKEEYVKILKFLKNDSTDYYHKFASYLIRRVSVSKHINNPVKYYFTDNFGQDIVSKIAGEKIVNRKVNFGLNSSDLNDDTKKVLNNLIEMLNKNEKINIDIIGHTDSIGSLQFNLTLSEKRAKSVYDYLIFNGINSSRLKYEGKGESEPLDEIQIKNNLGYNRRVEFVMKINK